MFFLEISVNDKIEMKKQHPCGGKVFTVQRAGMDIKIRCDKCGREVMVPRQKIEKNIKRIIVE